MNTAPSPKPGSTTPPDTPPPSDPKVPPAPIDLTEESVAGEEDPGASMDVDVDEPPPGAG